jgi:hypothetical protein
LTVVYNRPSAPLVLDRLFVQGGDFRVEPEWPPGSGAGSSSQTPILPLTTARSAGITSSSTTTSPSASSIPQSVKASPSGAIAGGVVGGVALLLLALLATFFIRKRRRRSRNLNHDLPAPPNSTSFAPNPAPFSTPTTASFGQSASPPATIFTEGYQPVLLSPNRFNHGRREPSPSDVTSPEVSEQSPPSSGEAHQLASEVKVGDSDGAARVAPTPSVFSLPPPPYHKHG